MTFKQYQSILEAPPYAKIAPYLQSFWSLTKDERARVRAKHRALSEYLDLFDLMMMQGAREVQIALEARTPLGTVLQVESIESVLRKVTYP